MKPIDQGNLAPYLFEYSNYRLYLKNIYDYLKKTKPQFSYRFFARQAGFQSPNFLKLVIEGKRNLSGDSIERFVKALRLNSQEAIFFRNLVAFNQAENTDEKEHYAQLIFRSSLFRQAHQIDQGEYDYYTQWYMVPIRELVRLPGFQEDPRWISQNLNPQITVAQAEYALSELLKLGLIKRNELGRLVLTDNIVTTKNEVHSTLVARFHKEMMRLAGESLTRVPRLDRDISSVTISVSSKNAKRIKELIQNFREELLTISGEDKEAERIYQLNFQFFPLSKSISVTPAEDLINHDEEEANEHVA